MHRRIIMAIALIACLAGTAFADQDPDSPIIGRWDIVDLFTFDYSGSVSHSDDAIGSFAFDAFGRGEILDEGSTSSLAIRWSFDRVDGRFKLVAGEVTLTGYAQLSGKLLVVILEDADANKAMFVLERAE